MSAPTPSKLDHGQVLQGAFDDSTGRLRVDAEISASIITPPGLEVSILATSDNIAIRNTNNSNELLINSDGSIAVKTVQLFTKPYDAITVSYPSGTQEIYISRVGGIAGVVQQTATVNYVDSSKVNLLNVAVV